MSYAVRHEGSPVWVDDLSAADVATGLLDGRWQPTDEVRDQSGVRWTPLEDHPQFAEAANDVAPPTRKEHPDETRLDMNPLIDVALVLLIFFILTTTYETIRKVLDMPGTSQAPGTIRQVDEQTAKKLMILVTVRQDAGQPIIKIEDRPVRLDELDAMLRRAVVDSKKTTVLVDASPDVDYGVVIAVKDAAQGAGVSRTLWAQQKQTTSGAAGPSR
jgi:biopolymer transport protein ExbD